MSKVNTVEEPLQWMYDGDKTDPEEYLLGKPIDGRTQIQKFVRPDDIPGTYTVDMANKIREDPLFLMKKHECEQTKKIMENPFRIKRLKEMIEIEQSTRSERILADQVKRANEREEEVRGRVEIESERASQEKRISGGMRSRYRSRSQQRHKGRHSQSKKDCNKYSASDLKARLDEMQKNGEWREKQRSENVARTRQEIANQDRSDRSRSRMYVNPSRHGTFSYSSLQDNIKRNPQRYRHRDTSK